MQSLGIAIPLASEQYPLFSNQAWKNWPDPNYSNTGKAHYTFDSWTTRGLEAPTSHTVKNPHVTFNSAKT